MKPILCGIILLAVTYITSAQDYVGSFNYDGHEREYEVYLPQDFQANMPLIVSLHGITETVYWYKTYTEMHEVADTLGYVIVYPQGVGNSWNAGLNNPNRYFPDTDDVGFISALIDTMKTRLDIDLSRVYCCGYSLGGMMSFRMAGECGHRFAAIASVSGPLFGLADTWESIQPMPVLHMHGTDDGMIPYDGEGDRWSAQNTINYWLEKNQCTAPTDTFSFPDIAPNDGCTIQKFSYTGCSGKSKVIHYKGINMGHSWPGSKTTFGSEGNKNLDINANVEIMHFFKQFENPLGNLAFSKTLEVYPFHIQSPSDTITVRAKVNNPENHKITVYAYIHGEQFTFEDSIRLYDDGLHEDGDPSDNIWGNKKMTAGYPEDAYEVGLVTYDSTFSISYYHNTPERFIKFGPIAMNGYESTNDTIPEPGDWLMVEIQLVNNGLSAIATEITASLKSLDTMATIPDYIRSYEDMAPGATAKSNNTYTVTISADCPFEKELPIEVTIYSHGYECWRDTFYIVVTANTNIVTTKAPAVRIFPNPVHDLLTIETSQTGHSLIEITSLNSQIILSKEMEGTTHLLDLSSFQKGVYFITIRSKDYMTTRKIIKL